MAVRFTHLLDWTTLSIFACGAARRTHPRAAWPNARRARQPQPLLTSKTVGAAARRRKDTEAVGEHRTEYGHRRQREGERSERGRRANSERGRNRSDKN